MTTGLVLDASVTLGWVLGEDSATSSTARAALLDGAEAFVPTLWRYEVANALVVNERRGRLSRTQADDFVDLLESMPIYEEDAWPSAAALMCQGRVHGLTAYDAAYLVIAQRLAMPLATEDQQLRAAASNSQIELL